MEQEITKKRRGRKRLPIEQKRVYGASMFFTKAFWEQIVACARRENRSTRSFVECAVSDYIKRNYGNK